MQSHNQRKRHEAIRMHMEEGIPMIQVSNQLKVSYKSIREWVRRYKAEGEKGLLPKYSNCGKSTKYDQTIIAKALHHKKKHPEWGAPFILLKLEDEFPQKALPSARRLQQIFKSKKVQKQKDVLPKGEGKWAKAAFDRVQVDAKERLKTKDGQNCCYLNFTDEFTGSDLGAFVFPLRTDL